MLIWVKTYKCNVLPFKTIFQKNIFDVFKKSNKGRKNKKHLADILLNKLPVFFLDTDYNYNKTSTES